MERIGRYQVVQKLAMGGMAEVFLAQIDGPAGFHKTAVLKRILPHFAAIEEFANMFLNEARLAALLNHPNIVQIIELGQDETEETYFIAMELVDGPSLRGLIQAALEQSIQLPLDVVLKIISLTCEGLAYAHEFVAQDGTPLKLIHRDISPDNILLGRSGAVKVADFGIAKAANVPAVTQTGVLKGKVSYMPPEAYKGHPIDQRADIFAVGVVLFEALARVKPFMAPTQAATMEAILKDEPRPITMYRPDAPAELQQIISKSLVKDPRVRYQDARSLQADLEALLVKRGSAVRAVDIAGLIARLTPAAPAAPTPALAGSLGGHHRTSSVAGKVQAMPAVAQSAPAAASPVFHRTGSVAGRAPSLAAPPTSGPVSLPDVDYDDQEDTVLELPRPRGGFAAMATDPVQDAALGATDRSLDAYEEDPALAPLSPEEERARLPRRSKHEPRLRPSTTLMLTLVVVAGLTIAGARMFMPEMFHLHRAQRPGAQVVDAPGNKLIIDSIPPGAEVYVESQKLGVTPVSVENKYGFGQKIGVSIHMIGYSPVEGAFVGGRGQHVSVTLGHVEDE